MRAVIDALSDDGSVLELRRGFGAGMVTALARVEGRPLGIVANDPAHLGGAIDADGADKAARFMQLCDAFDLPLLFLCDTPGLHGRARGRAHGHRAPLQPDVRHRRQPRRSRSGTIVLRKGYGLGAQAMAGGGFKAPLFTRRLADRRSSAAWASRAPSGSGMRRELEAIEDRPSASAAFDADGRRAPTSAARGSTWPPTSRSTT